MKITVTQEHIDKGKPRSCQCCPVALACAEASVPLHSVGYLVTPLNGVLGRIEMTDGRGFDLPVEVTLKIMSFDRDLHMEPFTFDLPCD